MIIRPLDLLTIPIVLNRQITIIVTTRWFYFGVPFIVVVQMFIVDLLDIDIVLFIIMNAVWIYEYSSSRRVLIWRYSYFKSLYVSSLAT